MANLTLEEFQDALKILADGGSADRLRDRLVKFNAFHSRRGLNSFEAIAERIFSLSSGLRRDVPANRVFQALWAEKVASGLTQKSGTALDDLADKINATLDERGELREGQGDELDVQLAAYEEMLARKVTGKAARIDMLQKAVPIVAEKLRAKPVLDLPLDPPEEDDDHVHGPDCDHDHDHGDGHGHGPDCDHD
jgi:hypothetical protein